MSGSKKVFTTLGSSNHVPEEREAFDYYATDPKAVEMLLELEQFSPVIWEPACGEGHISKVLQAHGYEVISTDLIYRGFGDPEPLDFLKETLDDFEGDIITNPPYSMGLEFVQRALESVRHRMASYCQESTRYCNYGKGKFGEEITVIEPCFWPEGSDLYWSWKNACLISEQCYFSLLKSGATPAGSPFRSTQQPENGSGYDGQHSGMAAFPEVAVFARRTSADAGSGLDSVRES